MVSYQNISETVSKFIGWIGLFMSLLGLNSLFVTVYSRAPESEKLPILFGFTIVTVLFIKLIIISVKLAMRIESVLSNIESIEDNMP